MIDETTIIGLGKVGRTLHNELAGSFVEVVGVTHDKVDKWLANWVAPEQLQVIVLTIPAHAIADMVARLAALDLHNTLVLHTNGSMQPTVLAPLEKCGAMIAAAHPFQTFSNDDTTALDGIAWGVECADAAWEATSDFVDSTGGYAVHLGALTPDQKRIYHASAVAASNFSYAAYNLARKLGNSVGIDAATFLSPIMERTLQNAVMSIERQEQFDITGPLARGDEQAVIDQLNALPKELQEVYAACSLGLLDAIQLSSDQHDRMKSLLQKTIK